MYAQVAVNIPTLTGVFDYAVPPELAGPLQPGCLVAVPLEPGHEPCVFDGDGCLIGKCHHSFSIAVIVILRGAAIHAQSADKTPFDNQRRANP